MMIIFETKITRIGSSAHDALLDNMLILFREGAPIDLEEHCFIHAHSEMDGELEAGNEMQLGNEVYLITAVGKVASINLRELGHITVHFDSAHKAELSGSIHVKGHIPAAVSLGSTLKFIK
ncbi:PTS glucitol/sorbitol transporter subunit IIA [Xenorhabdus sp. M]|uniref:PTS glucitol/sorbitol transporter subunit IIA n=1 Tax=Xenorhabdus szentirmaii TaxID=290112 RepID=A0AAW3YSG0_9GAMM|nr:PTS glucitol/sorbitol transporter subunit IIA [Xenorhabdus sp. M]MBD2799712.1 PTS glucitol/sorbitol transporter subunit IIA [Xenorhabdus sp. M]